MNTNASAYELGRFMWPRFISLNGFAAPPPTPKEGRRVAIWFWLVQIVAELPTAFLLLLFFPLGRSKAPKYHVRHEVLSIMERVGYLAFDIYVAQQALPRHSLRVLQECPGPDAEGNAMAEAHRPSCLWWGCFPGWGGGKACRMDLQFGECGEYFPSFDGEFVLSRFCIIPKHSAAICC